MIWPCYFYGIRPHWFLDESKHFTFTNESPFNALTGIEQLYSIENLAFISYNPRQIIIIKLQTARNERPQGSCWFATL